MRILFESSDYTDVLVKKALLDQEGFLVHMDNFEAGSIMPHLALSQGYRLWVPDDEFQEALALLSPQATSGASVAPEDCIDTCPTCSSDRVVRYRAPIWLPVFVLLDFLIPSPHGNRRKCLGCGHIYKTSAPELTRPLVILFFMVGVIVLFALSLVFA
ncbi:putative signal transducing protein [Kordiimonas sp.]|uniref:putative signal transducing protein n=1 Tax=Kordiimonas sp. TaxID=1970157 RepID=UPI003A8D8D6C